MIEKFLGEIVVIDTESTGINVKTTDIIELAIGRMEGTDWYIQSKLFSPRKPIPFAASAINNISRKMVEGLPLFSERLEQAKQWFDEENTKYFVSHNTQYDVAVLNNNFKRGGIEFPLFSTEYKKRWICTLKLARIVLADSTEEELQFNQQYLRYMFDLDSKMNNIYDGPHRASSDTHVCALLLTELIKTAISNEMLDSSQDIGDQLEHLLWDPRPVTKWPYGKKYRGWKLTAIPDSFYLWALTNIQELKEGHQYFNNDLAIAVEKELTKRLA